jgi:hypothetical protein
LQGGEEMSMSKPEWFEYIEWDYSDKMYPKMKGFKEGTPEDIKKKYYEFQKFVEKSRREGYDI